MRALLLTLILMLIAGLVLLPQEAPEVEDSFELRLDDAVPTLEFAKALEPRAFSYPQDHGPHPEFQTEWWYYTGNLLATSGEEFGFQLTIFRRALHAQSNQRASSLATHQLYFGHFAVSQAGEAHLHWERFSRGAGGLAGASADPFRIWLEDWEIAGLDVGASRVRIRAKEDGHAIDLELRSTKPVVAHGQEGLSAKGSESGNASYYLSFTRMETHGRIRVEGTEYSVAGLSWFDHEWGTSALSPQAVGWDWFGLQLDDGTDLMLFQIRNADGSIDQVSGGTLVDPHGDVMALDREQVQILALDTWSSQESGAEYPSGWQISVPEAGMELWLTPKLLDQEMNLSIVYWEGAVEIQGSVQGAAVSGWGYAELTGYAVSMQGMF